MNSLSKSLEIQQMWMIRTLDQLRYVRVKMIGWQEKNEQPSYLDLSKALERTYLDQIIYELEQALEWLND